MPKMTKKQVRLEAFKDKLNWGTKKLYEDDCSDEEVRTEADLSILSSGDEDLILCMTELQEDTDDEAMTNVVEERSKSCKVQTKLTSWLASPREENKSEVPSIPNQESNEGSTKADSISKSNIISKSRVVQSKFTDWLKKPGGLSTKKIHSIPGSNEESTAAKHMTALNVDVTTDVVIEVRSGLPIQGRETKHVHGEVLSTRSVVPEGQMCRLLHQILKYNACEDLVEVSKVFEDCKVGMVESNIGTEGVVSVHEYPTREVHAAIEQVGFPNCLEW